METIEQSVTAPRCALAIAAGILAVLVITSAPVNEALRQAMSVDRDNIATVKIINKPPDNKPANSTTPI